MSRKAFDDLFRQATKEKHSFLVINYSNDADRRFMDATFTPIKK
jgi:hypothetical protein